MVGPVDKETGRGAAMLTDQQCELLESEGVYPSVLQVLRSALGDRDEMELRWERR